MKKYQEKEVCVEEAQQKYILQTTYLKEREKEIEEKEGILDEPEKKTRGKRREKERRKKERKKENLVHNDILLHPKEALEIDTKELQL